MAKKKVGRDYQTSKVMRRPKFMEQEAFILKRTTDTMVKTTNGKDNDNGFTVQRRILFFCFRAPFLKKAYVLEDTGTHLYSGTFLYGVLLGIRTSLFSKIVAT